MLGTRREPQRTPLERIGARTIPIVVIFAITVILLWKIALTSQYTWINGPDYVNQVVPWFQFQAREWHAHRFPLWDPYHWGGQPLVGQAQPGAVYPLNWVLFLLPLKHGQISISILNWYLVVIHFMGAVFGYLLCRELRCSRSASVLGGVAFAFSGYLGATEWPQMINGVVWAPMVLLFFLRAMRGRRPLLNSSLSGACAGVAFLSGHHQAPMFLLLFMAGLWMHAFFTASVPLANVRGSEVWRLAGLAAAFSVFAFLFSAAQVLPAVEYGRVALRWVNARNPVGWGDKVPYLVHDRYSMNPVGALGIVIPGLHLNFNPFLGPTILLLAIGGAIRCWANRLVRILATAGVAALVFSLGSFSAFHGFLYSVILGLEKARSPSAAIFLFQLPAAVLAALGLDNLTGTAESQPDHGWRKLAWTAWGFGGVLYAGLFAVSLAQGDRVFYQARTAVVAFTAIGVGAVITACRRNAMSRASTIAALIALMIIDLSTIVGYPWASREQGWNYVDKIHATADIVQFLRAQPGDFRVGLDRDEIEFNLGDWEGIEQYNGYTGVTANMIRINGFRQAHLLLGERYYIGRKPGAPDQQEVFQSASGLRVYGSPDAQPRVWTVHHAIGVRGDQELFAQLGRPLSELRPEAVITGTAPGLDTCAGADEVRSVLHGQAQVIVAVRMACKGILILTDTFTPGWVAAVDGHPVQIYETYGAVRGVVVPPGDHRVEFRYRPASVFVGGALTGLGVVLLGAVLVFGWRSKTRLRSSPAMVDVPAE
jgi:hypothetical protein